MQVIVESADSDPGHVVEAAFDFFYIDGTLVEVDPAVGIEASNTTLNVLEVAQNPFKDQVLLTITDRNSLDTELWISVYNVNGSLVSRTLVADDQLSWGDKQAAGLYTAVLSNTKDEILDRVKLIKK